jgi:membrane protease YdiL (CAAX protease family)
MGCVLGLLYAVTGSLLAPIALHAVYDALWSAGPLLDTPLAYPLADLLRIPLHLAGLGLVAAWAGGAAPEKSDQSAL